MSSVCPCPRSVPLLSLFQTWVCPCSGSVPVLGPSLLWVASLSWVCPSPQPGPVLSLSLYSVCLPGYVIVLGLSLSSVCHCTLSRPWVCPFPKPVPVLSLSMPWACTCSHSVPTLGMPRSQSVSVLGLSSSTVCPCPHSVPVLSLSLSSESPCPQHDDNSLFAIVIFCLSPLYSTFLCRIMSIASLLCPSLSSFCVSSGSVPVPCLTLSSDCLCLLSLSLSLAFPFLSLSLQCPLLNTLLSLSQSSICHRPLFFFLPCLPQGFTSVLFRCPSVSWV